MVDFEDRERNTAWGYLVSIWRFLRRYPTIPIVVITLLVFSALFGPTLAPHDPLITEMSARYVPPPSFEYKKKALVPLALLWYGLGKQSQIGNIATEN